MIVGGVPAVNSRGFRKCNGTREGKDAFKGKSWEYIGNKTIEFLDLCSWSKKSIGIQNRVQRNGLLYIRLITTNHYISFLGTTRVDEADESTPKNSHVELKDPGLIQMSSVKNPVDIPLYWLVDRDPYKGLL